MYTEDFTVRYGELSSDGYVKPTAILQYLQEIATDHSGYCGYGVYELQEMGIGWVIMCWDVKLGRPIRWRERLTCRTWPYEFRSYVGKRFYEIVAEDGEVLAQADSWWAMMDLKEMKATPVTQEIADAFGEDGKPAFMMKRPGGEADMEADPVVFSPADIDTNGHVNNIRFAEMAFSYVPSLQNIREFRIEYRNSGHLGEKMTPAYSHTDGHAYVCLMGQEKPYVKMEVFYGDE